MSSYYILLFFAVIMIILMPHSTATGKITSVQGVNCTNCWYGCDNVTGQCSGECGDGFYGEKCDHACLSCYACNKTTGFCTECRDRHYGSKCEYRCAENCLEGCFISGKCFACNEGFYGSRCNLSCPSPHCRNGCDRYTGNCTSWGCDGGYWGNSCNKTCPVNCGEGYCHQIDGSCQTCKPGFSGRRCTDRCMDKQCSLCQFDASKCYECFTGWYGKHCDEKCPKHCSTADCDQGTGKCQKCKNGYFGEFCNGKCDVACDTCSDNVSCDTCKKSLYGVFCNLVCPKECIDCARDGKCETCSAGYFGADCMCSIAECTNATNNKCFRCRNNMTWYSFQNGCCPCSEHCLQINNHEPTCNFNTGNCMHGCKNNYIGEKCIDKCSENCETGNFTACINGTTICQNGCKDGWYLPKCEFNCSLNFPHCEACEAYTDKDDKNPHVSCHKCQPGHYSDFYTSFCKPCENCIDDECDGSLGFCNKGCRDGWYAQRDRYLCEYRCSSTCVDQSCDNIGGACLKGCHDGYYGQNCGLKCSNGCMNGTCNNTNGECALGCTTPTYGNYCNVSCSNSCGEGGCNDKTGVCFDCKAGRYGEECNFRCSGCLHGDCRRQSGECGSSCIPGMYGRFCNSTCVQECLTCNETTAECIQCEGNLTRYKCDMICGKNCRHNICDKYNGTCADGCVNGYFGQFCIQKCNTTCKSSLCNDTTGTCLNGCVSGWKGPYCAVSLPYLNKSWLSTGMIVLIVILVAASIAVLIAIFARLWFTRQQDNSHSLLLLDEK